MGFIFLEEAGCTVGEINANGYRDQAYSKKRGSWTAERNKDLGEWGTL